jgi:chemotaxis regulatin CheY-phosphate phosphatase CheZ
VYLNDVSKDGLRDEAEELADTIADCRERLMILVGMSPRESEDCEGNTISAVDNAHQQASKILAELADAVVNKHLVDCALGDLDSVEEHY